MNPLGTPIITIRVAEYGSLRVSYNYKMNPLGYPIPPKKLRGSGVSTPYTFLCLICTTNSELQYFLIFTHWSEPGSISAGFQWTGSTPAGFQEAFRVDYNTSLGIRVS